MVEFKSISMKFGDFYANRNISFSVKSNEIHALLGENGAGKSTLMSVLFGLYNPTEGEIYINNKRVDIKSPKDASKYKIAMLPQHFKLVDNMTVWENIILGNEKLYGKIFVKKKFSKKLIEETMKKYKLMINLSKKVKSLTTSQKQKVELLKMLWRDNDILIFDEPTSILTPQEIKEFMNMLNNLKKDGKTILLITHKLSEIKEIADNCSIIRKGKFIKTVKASTSSKKLVSYMVGKEVDLNLKSIKKVKVEEKLILKVNNLWLKTNSQATSLKGISFSVNSGEIVGLAAIDGNGHTELIQSITGMRKFNKGSIIIKDIDVKENSIKKIYFGKDYKSQIMAHIPEDRHMHGLFLDIKPERNAVIQEIDLYKKPITRIIDNKKITDNFNNLKDKYDIRGVNSKRTITRDLSGGNQQKLIVAREIERKSNLIVAAHITRGLDVGAIRNIYTNLISKRNEGSGVLLYSGELDEIIQVSDRVIVLHNGKIVSTINKNFDKQKIGALMLNGAKNG